MTCFEKAPTELNYSPLKSMFSEEFWIKVWDNIEHTLYHH